MLPVYLDQQPSGTSTRPYVHYAQLHKSKKPMFKKFDFGSPTINQARYGSSEPPFYNLSNIKTPVALWTSDKDLLVDPQDVHLLSHVLPNVSHFEMVNITGFTHSDFTIGINADTAIYHPIIERMLKSLAWISFIFAAVFHWALMWAKENSGVDHRSTNGTGFHLVRDEKKLQKAALADFVSTTEVNVQIANQFTNANRAKFFLHAWSLDSNWAHLLSAKNYTFCLFLLAGDISLLIGIKLQSPFKLFIFYEHSNGTFVFVTTACHCAHFFSARRPVSKWSRWQIVIQNNTCFFHWNIYLVVMKTVVWFRISFLKSIKSAVFFKCIVLTFNWSLNWLFLVHAV